MPDTGKPPCTCEGLQADISALEAKIEAVMQLIGEREERTKDRFVAADKAINKAELATERRFESVNEFRQTLADQATLLLPRAEFTAQLQILAERLEATGKISGDKIDILSKSFGDRMDAVNKIINALQLTQNTLIERGIGKSEGLSVIGQVVLGVIAFVSAVAAAVTAVLHFR